MKMHQDPYILSKIAAKVTSSGLDPEVAYRESVTLTESIYSSIYADKPKLNCITSIIPRLHKQLENEKKERMKVKIDTMERLLRSLRLVIALNYGYCMEEELVNELIKRYEKACGVGEVNSD